MVPLVEDSRPPDLQHISFASPHPAPVYTALLPGRGGQLPTAHSPGDIGSDRRLAAYSSYSAGCSMQPLTAAPIQHATLPPPQTVFFPGSQPTVTACQSLG